MSKKRILEWDDDLSTGDAGMDTQVKSFLRKVNEFIDLRDSPDAAGSLNRTLGFLADYSREHFSSQEKLMTDIAYPSIQSHKAEHHEFSKQLSILYRQLIIQKKSLVAGARDDEYDDRGLDGVITDAYDFLINWYDSHMLSTDKRLTEYFKYEHPRNKSNN